MENQNNISDKIESQTKRSVDNKDLYNFLKIFIFLLSFLIIGGISLMAGIPKHYINIDETTVNCTSYNQKLLQGEKRVSFGLSGVYDLDIKFDGAPEDVLDVKKLNMQCWFVYDVMYPTEFDNNATTEVDLERLQKLQKLFDDMEKEEELKDLGVRFESEQPVEPEYTVDFVVYWQPNIQYFFTVVLISCIIVLVGAFVILRVLRDSLLEKK